MSAVVERAAAALPLLSVAHADRPFAWRDGRAVSVAAFLDDVEAVAAMLPCNVVVRAVDDTTTLVEVFDPSAMMALADNEALDAVAAEAGQRIAAVLDDLGGSTDSTDAPTRRA